LRAGSSRFLGITGGVEHVVCGQTAPFGAIDAVADPLL
jgi:hypothetical protein